MELIRFVFSSFWKWLGAVILLTILLNAPVRIIIRLIRRSMVLKQGWPPAHLDADGDWKPEPSTSENSHA
jgi:hypothetical protein